MITFLILAIYTVSGVILFATRDKLKKLTLVEYLFIPSLIISNILLVFFIAIVYSLAFCYGYLSAWFKR